MDNGSIFAPEVQAQAKAFSLLLARTVREYFGDAQNRLEFEAWYEEKYGKPYVWRKIYEKSI